MKIVFNNLLVLIIFLAPVLGQLDMDECHSHHGAIIKIDNCDEHQKSMDMEECCDNCYCENYIHAFTLHNTNDVVDVDNNQIEYISQFKFSMLSQLNHPPFRPPII